MKRYSVLVTISNIVYVVLIVLQLSLGVYNIRYLIIAYIFADIISICYGIWKCRDIFTSGFKKFTWTWNEASQNIKVGVHLLISNLVAMMIISVIRVGIQKSWGVVTFGKVSLTLSISNLLMTFISAVSVVLFPKLRMLSHDKLQNVYQLIRDILMPLSFVSLLIYFPVDWFIPQWLPHYSSALIYMSILFPMVAYQAKFEILSSTFLQVMRMERQLLTINVCTLLFSILSTILTVFVIHNLDLAVFSIIIVMALRSIVAEYYVKKKINLNNSFEFILESTIVLIFILLTWYLNNLQALIFYMIVLLGYLLFKRKDILLAVKSVKKL